jgi:hypothetical protein
MSGVPGLIATPFALSGGSWIFAVFIVVLFLVIVYSYYTRRGSGINQRPYADLDHSSGPESPSELAHDTTQEVRNWDRGVADRVGRRRLPGRVAVDDDELGAALRAWRSSSQRPQLAARPPASTPARGPDAGVDLIVFWDYAAPDVPKFGVALRDLRSTMQVREIALHLPVADAHPTAFPAALAVEAARAQDLFWVAHESLLEHAPGDARAIDALWTLVPDRDRFRADVERQSGRERILEDIALAAASGVHAVPTVFIAGVRYDGEPDVDELTAAIQRLPAYRPRPT